MKSFFIRNAKHLYQEISLGLSSWSPNPGYFIQFFIADLAI